jgi:hypothetical protein
MAVSEHIVAKPRGDHSDADEIIRKLWDRAHRQGSDPDGLLIRASYLLSDMKAELAEKSA